MMGRTVDNLSTTETGETCHMLETGALGLDRVCSEEILELVPSADYLFITRTALSNVGRTQRESVNGCSQCRTAGEPFDQPIRI